MDKLSDTNTFIELFENLYDAIYFPKEDTDDSREIDYILEAPKKKKTILSLFKKEEVIEKKEETLANPIIDAAFMEVKKYLDNILSNPSQTFWTLWKVCQFVRWAEKVFLYDNDPKAIGPIYVDSEMNEGERNFVINIVNTTIKFKLQLIEKPKYTIDEEKYSQVINIHIDRNYGKKMQTKITILDGETDIADDSDLYLINQINRYINLALKLTFDKIIKRITPEGYKAPEISKGYYSLYEK